MGMPPSELEQMVNALEDTMGELRDIKEILAALLVVMKARAASGEGEQKQETRKGGSDDR